MRKKVLVVVVAVGIVAGVAVFFFSGSSAPKEASKLYGVWRVTGFNFFDQTIFMEFSSQSVTSEYIGNDQSFPPDTVLIRWGFRDGKLCYYKRYPRDNDSFLERLFHPDSPDEYLYVITFMDENTVLVESAETIEKGTVTMTSEAIWVRSSPAERDAAITERVTHEQISAQRRAQAAEQGTAATLPKSQ